MTTPDDLIEFLRQQLDEDERVARALDGEGWNAHDPAHGMRRVTVNYSIECVVACTLSARGVHIARHDPARILAEVDAKRRLLDWLDEAERFMDCDDMSWHSLSGAVDVDHARRLLLLPYADREGYREQWRP